MKNFICFVILLIFAAFVFFIGWTQIKVKPGTVGVVQSKTGGIDKKPVIPGKFSWHKEFLIPSNAKLNVFDVKPYNGTKTINASRGGGNDFMITFQISLAYDPLIIVNLLEENKVSCQQDMELHATGPAFRPDKHIAGHVRRARVRGHGRLSGAGRRHAHPRAGQSRSPYGPRQQRHHR